MDFSKCVCAFLNCTNCCVGGRLVPLKLKEDAC